MLVYWLLLAGSLLVGYPLCRFKYGKEIYCVLMGFALFWVAAIRQGVGFDYNSYGQMYIDFHSLDIDEVKTTRIEKGVAMPLKMLTNLFPDYHVLFYVTSFIFAAILMIYIYKKSEKPYLAVFCFLAFGGYFVSMDFLRQYMAALVMLYAIRYIERKQFLRFFILMLLAFTFHVSSLIMLFFYVILRIKMNSAALGVYTALTVVFFIFSWQILDLVTDYVYKNYDPTTSREMLIGVNPTYAFFFGFFFVLAFLFRRELVQKAPENNLLLNCMFFFMFFELCGVKHAIISRFSIFFMIPATAILMPRLLDVILEKCDVVFRERAAAKTVSKVVVITVLFALCATMYTLMVANNFNGVREYRTIFSGEAV